MQNIINDEIKLRLDNQEITYTGEILASIFKEIDYILCSLHTMGSYYYDKGKEEYAKETADFIDKSCVCERLAIIRYFLGEKFDSQLGEDEMDDLERVCGHTPYWRKPGDYCSDIWLKKSLEKYQ